MSLDDYIPKKLSEYILYDKQVKIFLRLKEKYKYNTTFFNIIVNGVSGIGKKTLIYTFINELFEPYETNLKLIEHEIKVNNNTITTFFKKSLVYYIIDPSIYINYDKIFISTFIDKYVSTINIYNNNRNIVILENSDKLSSNAQEYLKKKIESIINVTNFILISNSLNHLDKALLSRFVIFNMGLPKNSDLIKLTNFYMKKFDFKINNKIINSFINIKPFSIYNFILNVHSYRTYSLHTHIKCEITNYPNIIVKEILKCKYDNIKTIRSILFNIMISNIYTHDIFKNILNELLNNVTDGNIIASLCKSAANCQHQCVLGNKPIIFLELFCIEAICIIKNIQYLE